MAWPFSIPALACDMRELIAPIGLPGAKPRDRKVERGRHKDDQKKHTDAAEQSSLRFTPRITDVLPKSMTSRQWDGKQPSKQARKMARTCEDRVGEVRAID